MAHDHRSRRQHDGGNIRAGSGHHLGRQGLVATADYHHRVHGLRADHLFGIHRHQVAQEHRGGVGEALADGNSGKHHRQTASEHHAALHALNQVGHIAVAWIVVAEGIGYADDRAFERIVGVAHGLDKCLAEEQREAGIAIAGQPFA